MFNFLNAINNNQGLTFSALRCAKDEHGVDVKNTYLTPVKNEQGRITLKKLPRMDETIQYASWGIICETNAMTQLTWENGQFVLRMFGEIVETYRPKPSQPKTVKTKARKYTNIFKLKI